MNTDTIYQFIELVFMPSFPVIAGIVIAFTIIIYLIITLRDYL